MFHWQLALLFILCVVTSCMSGPGSIDYVKACMGFTGAYGGDATCAAYCKATGKNGGSCIKKRCVCDDNDKSNEENATKKPSLFSLVKPKANIICNGSSSRCQLDCKSMGKFNGSCINGVCVCLRSKTMKNRFQKL